MANPFPAEPLSWALAHAERDGLRGEEALVRALELVVSEGGPSGQNLVGMVQEAVAVARRSFEIPEQDRIRARKLVAKLEPLNPQARLAKIALSRGHYRGVAIGEALLEHSWMALPANGQESGSWAICAIKVIHCSDSIEPRSVAHHFAVLARAWALAANSARIACDLRKAEKLMEQAILTVEMQGVYDLATRAEVLELAAVLQRARRHYDEAANNLRWTAAVWEILSRDFERARTLVTLATTLQAGGEVDAALDVVREALNITSEVDRPRLALALHHMEALYLVELGRLKAAEKAVSQTRRLAEPFTDQFTQLRVSWLDGRLARAQGLQERAVGKLEAAQAGFLALNNPYDSALVSIDLATLHLEAGRYQEAAELATAMAATFDALGVQREAWAACRLFADACERQRASVALAKNLARYLDQARQDPEYGFPASAVVG
ncbi:MAG: hypothetical protein SF066_09460 [Thermoanaerobaculia bacterium]|nr:hypothetical protein [Thermoanaerobaculia bacterium]